MSEQRTTEAALEILARELFVDATGQRNRESPAVARRRWYLDVGEPIRDGYRERAHWLVESLGDSEIELTWRAR